MTVRKLKEKTVTISAALYENIMSDWTRLRKLESHRDEWAKIAVETQAPKMKRRTSLPSEERKT